MQKPRLDSLVALLAIMACLGFVLGLRDVKLASLPERHTSARPAPKSADRTGELVVEVHAREKLGPALAKAHVRVFWQRQNQYFSAGEASTDTGGVARLIRVPRGVLWVLAEAEGYARSSSTLVLEEGTRRLQIELPIAHGLQIGVRDERAEPIARATVLVTGGDPLPFGALTREDGVARFTRLGPAPWTVQAAAPGYEALSRSGITKDESFTLRRLGSLEVAVELPDGTPAADASVGLASAVLWPARKTQTNSRGVANITGLLAGSYDVKASRGHLVSETQLGFELARGAHEHLRLRLMPGRDVTVLVTDGDGERAPGVAGADVVLAEQGLGSFPLRGRSDRDGKVRLGPISAGPAAVGARARDFMQRGAVPVPEHTDEPVRIALLRGATLNGTVKDARGRPVDGATIEIIGSDLQGLPIDDSPELTNFGQVHFSWALGGPRPLIPAGELGVMPGPVPPIPNAKGFGAVGGRDPLASSAGVLPEAIEPWVTRLDGTFRARPITPGRVRAVVRHPAYVEGASDPVTLGPGGEASVEVTLRAGGSLEGRLFDASRRPVGGARIDLNGVVGSLEQSSVTAEDGSFAFAALPSDIVLLVARPEEPNVIVLRELVRIDEGERKRVELVLPSVRENVTVAVRGARTEPLQRAQVSILSLDPREPLRRTAFTAEDGTVHFTDARGLNARVLVDSPGYARAERVFDALPDSLEIELTRGVIVEGRITAVRGRRSVSGASVSLFTQGTRKSAITNADGVYRLRDVSPGPARVTVRHPDFASTELRVEIRATARDDRPFELPAIDLEPAAEVSGTVTDSHGQPVNGARVAIGIAPAYLPAGTLPADIAVSDAQGRFTLRGAAAGPVTLEAYAANVGRGRESVELRAERPTTDVVIRLQAVAASEESTSSGGVAVTLGERGESPGGEVVVAHVADGSDAERAGLQSGDVLVAIDGRPVTGMSGARAGLDGPLGSDVVLEVRRDERSFKLRLQRESLRR